MNAEAVRSARVTNLDTRPEPPSPDAGALATVALGVAVGLAWGDRAAGSCGPDADARSSARGMRSRGSAMWIDVYDTSLYASPNAVVAPGRAWRPDSLGRDRERPLDH